eukprot:Protomagalhaensia_sp_Gyna_25__494@NODE_1233_length_2039_cov_829_280000_g984_i0_p2_GENE_NODE_1233_length_2039_cov_829_280000_g984_i0NODE_1233_length_2039_cov_829_280000_g984_i0_p2_ORF_typecomplete_len159_score27_95Ribosomal_L6e/PF01159_19/4_8e13KOW/PF00467_29/0_0027KOW/PF00467_29/1_4e03rRNA_procarch/PF13234_6/0_044_NODE_1233_length_2039_cov_829_280000_g984_i0144620
MAFKMAGETKPKPKKELYKKLEPGRIVIILDGDYRGKRAVVLKTLQPSGNVVVAGPHTVNRVPVMRVVQSRVIPTSTKLTIEGLNLDEIKDAIFKKVQITPKQGDKPAEMGASEELKKLIQDVETHLVPRIDEDMNDYLKTPFTLNATQGLKQHELCF